jgi:hypothetical protein
VSHHPPSPKNDMARPEKVDLGASWAGLAILLNVHQAQIGIRPEFRLVFPAYPVIMEIDAVLFPCPCCLDSDDAKPMSQLPCGIEDKIQDNGVEFQGGGERL